MSKITLDERIAEAVVLGGAVLGGGGGGQIPDGLAMARMAVRLGSPVLISLEDLNEDQLVVTASAVGAAAAPEKYVRPVDHIKALELLLHHHPLELGGIIANENGAGSGVNGWLQAAYLGLPVVDAPANGRAHPTGIMGAMGLHRVEDYVSVQAAAGGNPESGRHLELAVTGTLQYAANMIRHASVQAGGTVAVARNPVTVGYLQEHAAPGATSHAIRVGEAIMAARDQGPRAIFEAIASTLDGRIVCEGEVADVRLETVGGYDVGRLIVEGERQYELTFWNEFMTLEAEHKRVATFPDLITLLSLESGMPLGSAEIRQGQGVAVFVAAKSNLILGDGVCLPETLREAENAIRKPLLDV